MRTYMVMASTRKQQNAVGDKKVRFMKEQYITKSTLMSIRKWTKKMVNDFYPRPSLQVTNPHYVTAPKMKLYKIVEVVKIEHTEKFRTYWNKIAHKRMVARERMIQYHQRAKALRIAPHTDGMPNQRA